MMFANGLGGAGAEPPPAEKAKAFAGRSKAKATSKKKLIERSSSSAGEPMASGKVEL
eukprot:CAMPEP_0117685188 /NCGR_PEP_ID=MMETSP0804-20121206/21585_1 /TAXON_ID=1074897 /ORGANISM="Tetraselmis astigmatica, Strain CCMP880" /LENGTH=56 /DNA_ID=CAMNT_0005496401 /DNA_START=512 /DNA_END=682 /DNA_ORIENTATION=+